jgi:hypothetical protein
MSGAGTVGGPRRPTIAIDRDPRSADVDHRLDRQDHAFAEAKPMARSPEVGDLRLLVERGPDSVPHELSGDVYSHPQHAGRGGWSWYTGAAAWLHRAGLESILGLRRQGSTFTVDPCIPTSWPEVRIAWRRGETRYDITVTNPHARCRGVASAELDGERVDPAAIPLRDDGGAHVLRVVMGEPERAKAEARRRGAGRMPGGSR